MNLTIREDGGCISVGILGLECARPGMVATFPSMFCQLLLHCHCFYFVVVMLCLTVIVICLRGSQMDLDGLCESLKTNNHCSLNFSLSFILVHQPGILLHLGLDEYFMPCVAASRLVPATSHPHTLFLPEVIWDQVEQDSHILTRSK